MTGDWKAIRSADLNSCRWVGERMYLKSSLVLNMGNTEIANVPSWGVILQILALPFEHSAPDFDGGGMILARIFDVGNLANRVARIDHLVVVCDKSVPLRIFGQAEWAFLELLCSVERMGGFTIEDASQDCVGFLDLAYNNGLELTT